jgi:hypothetical protein
MSDRQAFMQRETETLFELIRATICLRAEYRVAPGDLNRVKILIDLRSLSERCYTFLVNAHNKGVSFEDLSAVTDACWDADHLGKFFCQAFLIEGPKFDELLNLYGHQVANPAFTSMFDTYKGDVSQAISYLSDDRLDRELKRQGGTNFPTRLQGYQPNQLRIEGKAEAIDLSGVLFSDQVLKQVETAFNQLWTGEVQQDEVIELFTHLKTSYPSQTKAITERITQNLYALPVGEVLELRVYAFQTAVPSLHECSVKTGKMLDRALEESEDKARASLKDLFDSLVMNKRYLEKCAERDIAENIKVQLEQADRDANDYFIGGNEKAALYAEFFKGLKNLGVDMDFMLLRGMSMMTTGAIYEVIDRGPEAVLKYAIKSLCEHYKDADTNVAKFFMAAWVLTYSKSAIQKVITSSDVAKAALYTITGDQDYLHDIKKPGLMEDVLSRDLGV